MPFHRDVWWLMGSAVAAIAAAPLLVHGDAATTAHRKAAALKIEQLSPAERQELEENLKRFEKLPAAEQAKYREIHARIEHNPAVAEALSAFSHWWPTVSAREQADLFRQNDVKQRIAVVSQIQEEIDRDRGGRVFFGWGWGRDGFRGPSLPRESFYEIMQALEALASQSYAVKDELPEIQALDVKDPQRYVKLCTALHARGKNWFDLIATPADENRLVEAISDKNIQDLVREAFRSRPGDRSPDRFMGGKHGWLRMQLAVRLGRELYLEMFKQILEDDVLDRKLASLSQDERDELYSLSAGEARWRLRMRVWSDVGAESKAPMPPVREFFQVRDLWPGRGDGGRGDGGRGDGGRGDGGRDGGRGDGGRSESGRRGEGRGIPGRDERPPMPPPPRPD